MVEREDEGSEVDGVGQRHEQSERCQQKPAIQHLQMGFGRDIHVVGQRHKESEGCQQKPAIEHLFARGASLIRNAPLLGPYSRTIQKVSWRSKEGGAVSYERGMSAETRGRAPAGDIF